MEEEIAKISDEFWSLVEPLLPPRGRQEGHTYRRQPGGGRKPTPARQVFEAILFVLRTGTPWKALPKSLGSASAIHRHYVAWQQAGFFLKLWRAGLAEHNDMHGVAWHWLATSEPLALFLESGSPSARRFHASSAAQVMPRPWQPTPSGRSLGKTSVRSK